MVKNVRKSKIVKETHTTAITFFIFTHSFIIFIFCYYKSDLNKRILELDPMYLAAFVGLMVLEWALFFTAGNLDQARIRGSFRTKSSGIKIRK